MKNNIITYLVPLAKELLELWSGVDVWDVTYLEGHQRFRLQPSLCGQSMTCGLWIAFRPTYQRIERCHACGPSTYASHSKVLGKTIYLTFKDFMYMLSTKV